MEEKTRRFSREDYQRLITFLVATRGGGDYRAVSLWDKDGELISVGCSNQKHAEKNTIQNADSFKRIYGATARILGRPCYGCAWALINAGVREIEYLDPGCENNSISEEIIKNLCQENNIQLFFTKGFAFVKILQQTLGFLREPNGPLWGLPRIMIIPEDKMFSEN